MECREGCGACCEAPSITTPLPGRENGKPGGARCEWLRDDNSCAHYDDRPAVCRDFHPSPEYCGRDRGEAMRILGEMEKRTCT